jgi:integrase
MALTDRQIKTAAPAEKPYKLYDSKGLFLHVQRNGSKYWRLKYRYLKKEKLLAIGVYPDVSLKEARAKVDEARKQLADGFDPSGEKQLGKLKRFEADQNSFEFIARALFERKKMPVGATGRIKGRWGGSHYAKQLSRLENELLPWIGKRPINEIKSTELLAVLRKIEQRGVIETAHRVKSVASEVFRYGVHEGLCERDISLDLIGALQTPEVKHMASLTTPEEVGPLLNVLDSYTGTPQVRAALKIAPLTFVRPKELRHARWADIDWEAKVWCLPSDDTKMKEQDLLVPLSTQVIAILRDLEPYTGNREYVFPGARNLNKPMSDNAVLSAMRRLDIAKDEFCGHGFRAMARTMIDERLGVRTDFIEAQLGHAVKDANGRAYNRTKYLDDRADMMQKWADYLDVLKAKARGVNVTPIERKSA